MANPQATRSPRINAALRMALLACCLCGPQALHAQQPAGWTLNVAVPDSGTTLDPPFAVPQRGIATVLNTYGILMTYALRSEANGVRVRIPDQVVGQVLESLTPNENFTVWTLKVRRGLKFSDGTPVTTAALRFMVDRTFKLTGSGGLFLWSRIAHIKGPESLVIVDDYTATLKTEAPIRILPNLFALSNSAVINPKLATLSAEDPIGATALKTQVSGGGPYTLESRTPNQIVLAANPHFEGFPNRPTQVIQRVVADSSNRLAFLRRGVVDMAFDLTPDEIASLKGVSGIKVVSTPNTNQINLAMNARMEPFTDVRVRKAIALALPYEQMVALAYHGNAAIGGGPIPIGVPGHVEKFTRFQTDLKAAKALLVGTALEKGGNLTLETLDDPAYAKLAISIQQALSQIGITVAITRHTPNIYSERRVKRAMAMFITLMNPSIPDPVYMMQLGYVCNGFFNYSNYCNPEVDKMIADAGAAADPAARDKLLEQVQSKMMDDVPVAWIAQPNYNLAMKNEINGYADFMDAYVRFQYLTKSAN